MIRPFLTRLAALLALAAAPALADPQRLPTPVPPTLEVVEAGPRLSPALWLVRDADTTIYLFGTVHMLKPGLNWLNGPVKDALDRSDVLVTEVVDDEASDAAIKQAMIKSALLPKGQTLRGLMSPEQRAAYEDLLKREGLPLDSFDTYHPWQPGLVLSMLPLMKLGMIPLAGAEEKLVAAAPGKPRLGLETAAFQIGLFANLSQEAQLHYLSNVVRDYDKTAALTEQLVEAWGKGDVETIGSVMNANMDLPELDNAILRDRNKAWAKWIEARLAEPGTVFIAVGAGHLAGPDSVQRQLSADGIRNERVQ